MADSPNLITILSVHKAIAPVSVSYCERQYHLKCLIYWGHTRHWRTLFRLWPVGCLVETVSTMLVLLCN